MPEHLNTSAAVSREVSRALAFCRWARRDQRLGRPVLLSAAIEDALSPYGVRITSLPISAEQIVEWAST